MTDRLDTLTEQSFRMNDRMERLETNVLLLGVACILCVGLVIVSNRA